MSNKIALRRIMPNGIAFDLETDVTHPSDDELIEMTELLMNLHTTSIEKRQISIKINNKRIGRNRNSVRRRGKKMVYINFFKPRPLKFNYTTEIKDLIDGATPDEAEMEARVYASQNPSQ